VNQESQIGSAHELLWNFLPARKRVNFPVALNSLRPSIKAGANEVKHKKPAGDSSRETSLPDYFARAMAL
jgi:hypothetical protein